jgi:hypothetical protein
MMVIDPDIAILMRALDDPERDALERVIARACREGAAKPQPQASKPRKSRERVPSGLKTRSEAAAKLGCSEKTLDGHVEAGTLRYVAIGHGTKRQRKMFTDADLDAFIEAQTRKDVPCPSIASPARRSGISISSAEVIGFSARRSARLAEKRKP